MLVFYCVQFLPTGCNNNWKECSDNETVSCIIDIIVGVYSNRIVFFSFETLDKSADLRARPYIGE